MIKIATKEDASSILTVIRRSYAPYQTLIPADCGFSMSLSEIKSLITDSRSRTWVAEKDKMVIGVATGMAFAPKAYHLKLLFISDKYQRQGVASQLLEAFEQFGREQGYHLITTNFQRWAPWSQSFYLKHGYKAYVPGDEESFSDLQQTVGFYRKIGKLNNDCKCFIWKSV